MELHDRSVCGWHWRLDVDPLRIPAILHSAECTCKKQAIDGILFECHLIKYRMKVMKYANADCDRLEPDEIELGVACVAAPVAREL